MKIGDLAAAIRTKARTIEVLELEIDEALAYDQRRAHHGREDDHAAAMGEG